MLNCDLENDRNVEVRFEGATPSKVLHTETITGSDLEATYTLDTPTSVATREFAAPTPSTGMTFALPVHSYTAVQSQTN